MCDPNWAVEISHLKKLGFQPGLFPFLSLPFSSTSANMGILEKIKDIEAEMARTVNK